jgi:transcriptional regulator with XRE-family HTH domain
MTSIELGKIISDGMTARGWSAKKLSEMANVPYDTARMASQGTLNPSLKTTTKLVVALDLKLEILPINDFETVASVEVVKQERAILQETLLEDAALEMQPTALKRLEEQVQIYGKKNRFGLKQFRDVVLVAGVLLELAWDVTSNDEPSEITEARAEELLAALS